MTIRRLLALAAVLAIALPAAASTASAHPAAGWRSPARDHARDLGPVRSGVPVTVAVGLHSDRAGLRAHLARVSAPGAHVRRLDRDALARRFGAHPSDLATVRRWARAHGLRATVNRARTRVVLTGSARRVERAFATGRLHRYRRPRGDVFVASTRPPVVPPAIAAVTATVSGLESGGAPVVDNPTPPPLVPAPLPAPIPSGGGGGGGGAPGSSACATQANLTLGGTSGAGYTPVTPFGSAQAYGFDGVGAGATYPAQTIAIIEFDQQYSPADVAAMQTACRFGAGAAPVPIAQVNLPGAQTGVGIEAELDAELVSSLAPQGTSIEVINASGSSAGGWAQALDAASQLPNLTAVSISYGASEMCLAAQSCVAPAGIQQADAILDQLAASGVTVTVAAGDQGSMGPGSLTPCASEIPLFGLPGYASVNWPASSPSVTGVGGTLWLGAARESGEQVWNEPAAGPFNWSCGAAGGGGGTSSMYLRPAWQTPATQALSGTKRLVPDLSMLAGAPGYVGVENGRETMFEGTSAAAPLLASGVLRLNAERLAAGQPVLGALDPTIYGPLAAAPGAITDLQVGNNDLFGVDCCTAGVGFDETSGLGAPNLGVWDSVLN